MKSILAKCSFLLLGLAFTGSTAMADRIVVLGDGSGSHGGGSWGGGSGGWGGGSGGHGGSGGWGGGSGDHGGSGGWGDSHGGSGGWGDSHGGSGGWGDSHGGSGGWGGGSSTVDDCWRRHDSWSNNRHNRRFWERDNRYSNSHYYGVARRLRDAAGCFADGLERDLRRFDYRAGRDWDRLLDMYESRGEKVVDRADDLIDELRDGGNYNGETRRLEKAIDDFNDLQYERDIIPLSNRTVDCLRDLENYAEYLD